MMSGDFIWCHMTFDLIFVGWKLAAFVIDNLFRVNYQHDSAQFFFDQFFIDYILIFDIKIK
jgi:hypothetical protein